MFQLDIEVDGTFKTYYVWDKEELIEVKAIEPDFCIFAGGLDISFEMGDDQVYVIATNLYPAIISEEEYDHYMESLDTQKAFNSFLPAIPITDSEYELLLEIAMDQKSYNEDEKISGDIYEDIDNVLDAAKNYVKKK